MELYGYRRSDGKVGVRNKILVLPTCSCSSETSIRIADMIDNAVTFVNQTGCSQTKIDVQYTIDTMVGFALNPNVYGTIVVGLGCEICSASKIAEMIRIKTDKPVYEFVIQEDGGTWGTIEKAGKIASNMAAEASLERRTPIDISDLIVATECGGTDATSGIAANPVMGIASDFIINKGGTVILSETPEFVGAEHILASRAVNQDISNKILDIVYSYEDYMKRLKTDLRDGNPAPGNKKGGITSLEEKSLGCIYKGGTTPIVDVVRYAEEVVTKGLNIMDTPGNDAASLCAMAAGGAVVAVFSTGRGTPMGNPIMPVIKITGNEETYRKMLCNIDFDASPVITQKKTIEAIGGELLNMICEVVNGKLSKAEALKMNEYAVARYCNYT